MEKMSDQQADSLRDQGKIVFKSSSSEAIVLAAMWSFFMLCIVSFCAYMGEASTWQEYAYFFLLFLLGSSFSVFILVINKITLHAIFVVYKVIKISIALV